MRMEHSCGACFAGNGPRTAPGAGGSVCAISGELGVDVIGRNWNREALKLYEVVWQHTVSCPDNDNPALRSRSSETMGATILFWVLTRRPTQKLGCRMTGS